VKLLRNVATVSFGVVGIEIAIADLSIDICIYKRYYFESCSDACMDLLDALAGNTGANSIAELSLNPLFPRSYNSIYKAIKASFNTTIQEANNEVEEEKEEKEEPNNLIRVVSELIDQPQQRPFHLFGLDTTPHPRPYARTLADRGYIYQPNTIIGNKPIIVFVIRNS
jgi:hypothetical protein